MLAQTTSTKRPFLIGNFFMFCTSTARHETDTLPPARFQHVVQPKASVRLTLARSESVFAFYRSAACPDGNPTNTVKHGMPSFVGPAIPTVG